MMAEDENKQISSFRGLTFKFSRKNDKTLFKTNLLSEIADGEDHVEYIESLEDKQIKSIKQENEKKDLVIPLIKQNVWRMPEESLDRQAILEIMQDACCKSSDDSPSTNSGVIPLSMQNRIPQGFEVEGERMDVSLRPDPSTLDDYERIPVAQFGAAMLRGMGWSPGTPIGLRNKNCVDAVEVQIRPKGLGLGADHITKRPKPKDDDDVVLRPGSFVCVESGFNKGRYGKIDSLDDDTGRAVVSLSLSGESVSVPELSLRPVTKKEFHREAHVLNKEKFLQQKEKLDRKDETSASWLRPQLCVRFIDEAFKGGKYYNTKMIVEKLSSQKCVCRTEDSQLLEGIHFSMLETVVPKSKSSRVMIVNGRKAGQVGQLLERDKRKCLVSVRLSSGKVLQDLTFDDVCEFVGH